MAEIDRGGAIPVQTPIPGLDPRDALATSMFSSRGVYAVLVGSGMSTAAGILTADRIVEDLIRRVARSAGADPEVVDSDPKLWWLQRTGGEPRYDVLLESLAPTDAARQSLLRTYFEQNPDTGEVIEPTAAHRALAQLCRRGFVRVIITTNFDPLIERALAAVGLTVQTLVGEDRIRSRIPLAHADVTVVKLHGDYSSLGLRNTPLELSNYGAAQRELLDRILDDYGLVVIGWSAEWDTALTQAIESSPTRRYPMYWVTYQGTLTETARRVIANRRAHPINSAGADDFLPDLIDRLDRIETRARRRGIPSRRIPYLHPDDHSGLIGWSAIPHLIVRTAAQITAIPAGNVGDLGPEERENILAALARSSLQVGLAGWNQKKPEDAAPQAAEQPPPSPEPLTSWKPVRARLAQSTDQATYRLGGDGRVGVSAVASIRLPNNEPQRAGAVNFILDVGVSVAESLPIWQLAPVLRDGLVLVTTQLPLAIADILPVDAEPTTSEIHLVATAYDGQQSRTNSLDKRLDLGSFNFPPDEAPDVGRSLAYAAHIPGSLTEHEAGELLAAALRFMLLAAGFLDPRLGLQQLRQTLGLPPIP